jgi:hypothetical protein
VRPLRLGQGDGDDYRPLIRKLQEWNVEILTGVPTPPDFATFWSRPATRACGPRWPRWGGPCCSLTGATAAEIAADYTRRTERQWTQPIGFAHALFEVAIDVLRRAGTPDDRQAIMRAIAATELDTVVGRVSWAKGPLPNIAKTPLVGGQWRRGGTFPFELAIVSNRAHPDQDQTGRHPHPAAAEPGRARRHAGGRQPDPGPPGRPDARHQGPAAAVVLRRGDGHGPAAVGDPGPLGPGPGELPVPRAEPARAG